MLLFVVIAGFGLVRLVVFIRRFRVSVRPGPEGSTLRIETSDGNLELEPRQQLDPRLAAFALYPEAKPQITGAPDYAASGGRAGRETQVTATYWTPDLSGKVLDFYRSRLPQWKHQRESFGTGPGDGHAWNFTDPAEPSHSIRIRSEYGGTTIENSIQIEN